MNLGKKEVFGVKKKMTRRLAIKKESWYSKNLTSVTMLISRQKKNHEEPKEGKKNLLMNKRRY